MSPPGRQTNKSTKNDAQVKKQSVRLMAPFAMHCLHCHHFIYRGTKFNARKSLTGESYLGIKILSFSIRCPHCGGEIVFRTDPQNESYACVSGADRNLEPWRNKQQESEDSEAKLDRLEKESKKHSDKLSELETSLANAAAETQRENETARLQLAVQELQKRQQDSHAAHPKPKSSAAVVDRPRFKLPQPKKRKGLDKK